MKGQINEIIDVLTRLIRYFFSHLTYDPNDDALRLFACWIKSSGLFNGTDVNSTIFSSYLPDRQGSSSILKESPVKQTSSVFPAPFKLRSRISQGNTKYSAILSTYECLFWSFAREFC